MQAPTRAQIDSLHATELAHATDPDSRARLAGTIAAIADIYGDTETAVAYMQMAGDIQAEIDAA